MVDVEAAFGDGGLGQGHCVDGVDNWSLVGHQEAWEWEGGGTSQERADDDLKWEKNVINICLKRGIADGKRFIGNGKHLRKSSIAATMGVIDMQDGVLNDCMQEHTFLCRLLQNKAWRYVC